MRFHEPFGISQNYRPHDNPRVVIRDLDAISNAGIKWLRTTFNWNHIEPKEGKFDFKWYDNLVTLAVERNVSLLPILGYSPSWAAQRWNFPPDDLEKYSNFARVVVDRYKKHIHYWEIWNEADSYFFWAGTPEEYVELLKVAHTAIKATDPLCKVLMCGLSDSAQPNKDFFHKVIKQTYGKYFDVLNLHAYPEVWSRSKAEDWKEILEDLRANRLAPRKPVWITETGYGILSKNQSEVRQARFLIRIMASMLGSGVPERIFWHELKDVSNLTSIIHPVKRKERRFGILQCHTFLQRPLLRRPSPAYFAYANLTRALSQTFSKTPEVPIEHDEELSIQCFENANSLVIIVWNLNEQMKQLATIRTPHWKKGRVTLRSIYGKQLSAEFEKTEKEIVIKNIPLLSNEPKIILVM